MDGLTLFMEVNVSLGLAPEEWRALFLKEEGSDGRPEANLYP
jgi:hypothetical protein